MTRPLLLLLIQLIFKNTVFCQDSTGVLSEPIRETVSFYDRFIAENSTLYNGSEYIGYDPRIRGIPYYEADGFEKGFLAYNHCILSNVALNYDIVRDEVLSTRYNDNVRIRLAIEKIDSFSLGIHFFMWINPDIGSSSVLHAGFYERVYNGKSKFFIKRRKLYRQKRDAEPDDKGWFEESDHFFVWYGLKFHEIHGKNDLFILFGKSNKEVKKFLRKKGIKYRKDKEKAIYMALAFFDKKSD
jgi:hypothetical protein